MSAEVMLAGSAVPFTVPRADRYSIDNDGRLVLHAGYGDPIAVFRAHHWDHVVITPERGPNGRFVKRR